MTIAVAASTLAWAQALGENNPDKVLPLYADDAVFWGTLSPTLRADRAALKELLDMGFQSTPVTIIDGEAIVGFDQQKIEELLGK